MAGAGVGLWVVGGAALALCLGAGAFAGVDSARSIDHFYTAAPTAHEQRALPAMPGSSAWDWNETPVAVATTVGSPEQAGRAERAFFDLGDDVSATDRAVEAAVAPVRVHRVRRDPEPRAVEPDVSEPLAPADDPADDVAAPPTT